MDKNDQQEVTLKRGLSLPLLIFYGVGTVLGSGVYILTGKIAGEAGMFAPLSFVLASIIAGFTGFSYAELTSRFPQSAGEVVYVKEAFHTKRFSTMIGYLIVLSAILSTATVSRGFVGYLHVFVETPELLTIILLNILIAVIALWGILESAILIMVITIIEIVGIIFFVGVAGHHLGDIPQRLPELLPSTDIADWRGIVGGAFLAFFTFIGFEDLVNEAEESKNPKRDLPIAIIFTLIMLTLVYLLVSLIAVLALPPAALAESKAPLSDILGQYNSSYPYIISLICLVASLNGTIVQVVMGSRVLYGMSKQSLAPKFLATLNPTTRTPVYATVLMIVFICLLALWSDLKALASYTDYVLIFVFMIVNLSLWWIKRKDTKRAPFTVPQWVPLVGFVLCALFLVGYTYFEWVH